jgi:cbb3-type cytochrome oxidase subunit 1
VIGHSHIGVLWFSGLIALGAMWLVLPLAAGRRIFSGKLVHAQFWLVILGLIGFATVLTIAGLIQGHAWYDGELEYEVLPWIHPYFVLRTVFGFLIFGGAVIGLFNILMTIRRGPRFDPALEEDVFA